MKLSKKTLNVIFTLMFFSILFVMAIPADAIASTGELATSNWLENIKSSPWIVLLPAVIGIFSAIATVTPNKVDNIFLDIILNVINVLGLNVGAAENKKDPE